MDLETILNILNKSLSIMVHENYTNTRAEWTDKWMVQKLIFVSGDRTCDIVITKPTLCLTKTDTNEFLIVGALDDRTETFSL